MTFPFPHAGGGAAAATGDPYWANVSLLCGFEGSDGSTTFDDESSQNHTLTAAGNAQIDTAQFKFGASSALFDGTGDRITASYHAGFSFGAGQFTVECFVRWNVLDANNRGLLGFRGGGSNLSWTFLGSSSIGELGFAYSTDGSTFTDTFNSSGAGMTTGVWYHVAVDRDGSGQVRLYVNGVNVLSTSTANETIFDPSGGTSLDIGAAGGFTVDMNGWLDEVRITKGVARYASDGGFTAPTAAFPRS